MPATTLQPTRLLRFALLADAAASGATGLLLAAAPATLSGLFGLPSTLLAGVGVVCLGWAGFTAWLGTRPALSRRLVQAVVLLNLLWVVDSALLLAAGPALAGLAPTGLGAAFVLAQAAAVLALTIAQWRGLRAGPPAAAFA